MNVSMLTKEERTGLVINIVGYSVITVLLVLSLTIILGNRFFGMMSFLGLDRLRPDPGWMYIDCSKPENRNAKFCQPRETSADADWKDVRRSGKNFIPFSLSPDKWEK